MIGHDPSAKSFASTSFVIPAQAESKCFCAGRKPRLSPELMASNGRIGLELCNKTDTASVREKADFL
jgi:hypothetical protein